MAESATAQEEGEAPTVVGKQDAGNLQVMGFEAVSVPGSPSKSFEFRYWQHLAVSIAQQPNHRKLMMLLSFWLCMAFLEFCFTAGGATSQAGLAGDIPLISGLTQTRLNWWTQTRLKGFTNTWWTSSLVLCPSNMEYRIANELVPIFFKFGFTPNGIVALNCCIRVLLLRLYYSYRYNMVMVLIAVCQVLDAADGQLARASGMTSAFGAALDHGTDNVFTVVFMLSALYLLNRNNVVTLKTVLWISSVFMFMAFIGTQYEKAVESDLDYDDCSVFAVMGMHQALHMLYIQWAIMIGGCYLTDWMPHQSVA